MNDAPFLAMSEYDFRSKCVAFECHGHGFAREVIVRDDRESTDKSKIRGAERPLGAQLVVLYGKSQREPTISNKFVRTNFCLRLSCIAW